MVKYKHKPTEEQIKKWQQLDREFQSQLHEAFCSIHVSEYIKNVLFTMLAERFLGFDMKRDPSNWRELLVDRELKNLLGKKEVDEKKILDEIKSLGEMRRKYDPEYGKEVRYWIRDFQHGVDKDFNVPTYE